MHSTEQAAVHVHRADVSDGRPAAGGCGGGESSGSGPGAYV